MCLIQIKHAQIKFPLVSFWTVQTPPRRGIQKQQCPPIQPTESMASIQTPPRSGIQQQQCPPIQPTESMASIHPLHLPRE
jgi:hypothetical protein